MSKWMPWASKFVTVAGDNLYVEYEDTYLPPTATQDSDYDINYTRVNLNGQDQSGDLEEFLDKLLCDFDKQLMFKQAHRRGERAVAGACS